MTVQEYQPLIFRLSFFSFLRFAIVDSKSHIIYR